MTTLDIVVISSGTYTIDDKCSDCFDGGETTHCCGSHVFGWKEEIEEKRIQIWMQIWARRGRGFLPSRPGFVENESSKVSGQGGSRDAGGGVRDSTSGHLQPIFEEGRHCLGWGLWKPSV